MHGCWNREAGRSEQEPRPLMNMNPLGVHKTEWPLLMDCAPTHVKQETRGRLKADVPRVLGHVEGKLFLSSCAEESDDEESEFKA